MRVFGDSSSEKFNHLKSERKGVRRQTTAEQSEMYALVQCNAVQSCTAALLYPSLAVRRRRKRKARLTLTPLERGGGARGSERAVTG